MSELHGGGRWGRWGLFRSIIGIGTPYMDRFVLQTPWFEVRLHHILRSDDDRALHDHPFDFTSVLLTGGYTEVLPAIGCTSGGAIVVGGTSATCLCGGTGDHRSTGPFGHVYHPPGTVVRRKASDAHRLILTKPVWTLCITGPRIREWGFYVSGRGWMHHSEYVREFGDA